MTDVNIPGVGSAPRWALIGVAAAGVAAFFLMKPKQDQAQQSAGLLAEEMNQRLNQIWEAWMAWFGEFMNEQQGPVSPPNDPVPPPTTEPGARDPFLPLYPYIPPYLPPVLPNIPSPSNPVLPIWPQPGECPMGTHWNGFSCVPDVSTSPPGSNIP